MPTLKLSLEDGFDHDHVVVTAGGKVLADERDVSTRYQISLARLLDLPLEGGEAELVITLPAKAMATSVPLGANPPSHVRASLSHDGRAIETSTKAPIGFA